MKDADWTTFSEKSNASRGNWDVLRVFGTCSDLIRSKKEQKMEPKLASDNQCD